MLDWQNFSYHPDTLVVQVEKYFITLQLWEWFPAVGQP